MLRTVPVHAPYELGRRAAIQCVPTQSVGTRHYGGA
jgi:hypothetical protein